MSLFLHTPIIKTAKAADSDRSTLSRSFCADTIKSVSLHEDHEYKVSAFSEFPPVSHTNSRIISIKNKQSRRLNRKRVVREVLGKMVLRKFLNNKRFFQVLAGLPERERAKGYKVGHNLVRKTRINLETSFLRSLLVGKQQTQTKDEGHVEIQTKNKSLPNKKAIYVENNVTVYPYEEYSMKDQFKNALKLLEEIQRDKIKTLIKKFAGNTRKTFLLKGYFARVTRNFNHHQHNFIKRLRLINAIQHNEILQTKRKILRNCLNRCLERRDKIIIEGLKLAHWEAQLHKNKVLTQFVHFLNNKVSSFFQLIKLRSEIVLWQSKHQKGQSRYLEKDKKLEQRKTNESLEEGVQTSETGKGIIERQEKKADLGAKKIKKIVCHIDLKWAFSNLKQQNQRQNWTKICADKIACNPKISIFRAFCRLRYHAKTQQSSSR